MKQRKLGLKIMLGIGIAAACLATALSWMHGTASGERDANAAKTLVAKARIKTEKAAANRVAPRIPAKPAVTQAKPAAKAIAPSAAMPVRSTLTENARVLDERMAKIAPAKKGGRPRFRKEWLIEDDGMKIHLDETYEQEDNGEMKLVASHEYAADRVMLKMDGEKDFEGFRKALAMSGYTVRNPLMKLEKNGKIVSVTAPTADLDTVANLQKAVASFDRKLTAETDDIVRVNRIPSDLRYPQLWGMEKIEAPRAWDTRTDATPVVVAVVDTGVNYYHQDLADNMWENPAPGTFDGYTDDLHGINACLGYGAANNGSPLDDNGHGTHCAGTIGAVGDNAKGVAGVAWNVRIMALKFLNDSGSGYTSDSIVCYDYAREHGADVVSCSFGGGCYSACVRAAIAALKDGNAVVVCAAGNDWTNNDDCPQYPSSYDEDNIVAVASTDINDELSWFSNFGATSVDIAAPGEGIVSTYWTSDTSYETLSGTSMATPHVAGALALIKAQFPDETYRQTIQRLYAGGDELPNLEGVVSTGKRLNVANSLNPIVPVAPTVTASAGEYFDKVAVSWTEVADTTHYKLWRALSETEEKTPLTGWTTDTSFDDMTAAAGTTYYYFVQAATDASGDYASEYSVPAAGYVRRTVRDAWDPTDDTPEGATLLVVPQDTTVAVHSNHTLNVRDPYDWFMVDMTAGRAYVFETTGGSDTYIDIYAADDLENRVDYDDDGGSGLNFRLSFTPQTSGVYYLRVRCYDTGADGAYDLQYSCSGRWDAWDPLDDTSAGATWIAVGDEPGSHTNHTLSVSDEYDWFGVELERGYTYTFYTTGYSDTYGELYDGDFELVEYDDDSGYCLNFRLTYTPETSGTHYLRVRHWCVGRDAEYDLHFSRTPTEFNLVPTPFDYYNYEKGWTANPFLTTNRDAVVGSTLFRAEDDILMRWAFNEVDGKSVGKPVTNLVEILNVDGVRLMWGHAVYDGDISGQFVDFLTEFPPLPTGGYMARITLNCDVWGNHTIEETDYNDNEMLIGFTVMEPAKRLTGIAITGNAEVESKQTAEYRCTATYSDTTEETVIPEWTISSGAAYADIAADGTLTAGIVDNAQTAVIAASFQGLTAVKTVTITPKRREHVSPFDPTVFYPNAPMIIVRGVVYIDGRLADEGDEVAAFGKSANGSAETRGYAKIEKEGRFSMPVYLARGAERITFKTCDVSAGDDGEVLVCMQTYIGVPGSHLGSVENPIRLDSCSWDPFGDPSVADTEAATLIAKVTIDGEAASSGDILAVYDGISDDANARLVGKQIIIFGNDAEFEASGACARLEARCSLYLYLTPGEHNLSFKVWDRNEQKLLESYTRCVIEPGQTVGSEDDPFLVEAVTIMHQDLSLGPKGWHLVSFNVLPDAPSNTTEGVFGEVKDSLFTVLKPSAAGDGMWLPTVPYDTLKTIEFGAGYWVETTEDDVAWRVQGHWSTDVEYSLAEGWNLIGYPLPRAGRIDAVLADLMASNVVEQIIGETASYPCGNLDVLQPGQAYWVKATRACTYRFNWTGMMNDSAARASAIVDPNAYGPFGDGRNVMVGANGAPVLYDRVPVTVFGQSANPGDCVAVYADGTNLVATAKVEDEDGLVSFPVYMAAGTKLSVRVWTIVSGLVNPVIYDADEQLTVPQSGTVVTDATISVTQGAGKDGFTVAFDLGEHAIAFAGETNQVVAFGESATAPTVTCAEGYAFLYWDKPFVNVRAATTVKAVYGQIKPVEPTPPPPGPDGQVTNVMVAVSKAGWHEMSFPVLPKDGDPAAVFAPVEDKISYVVSGSQNWSPNDGGTLVALEIGKGYWVQTTVPNVSWAVVGQGNPTVEIALKSGWNLIGYPLLEAGEIETVLAAALATDKILYICSESKVYPGTLKTMVPGKGYWVYATEAVTIQFDAD